MNMSVLAHQYKLFLAYFSQRILEFLPIGHSGQQFLKFTGPNNFSQAQTIFRTKVKIKTNEIKLFFFILSILLNIKIPIFLFSFHLFRFFLRAIRTRDFEKCTGLINFLRATGHRATVI